MVPQAEISTAGVIMAVRTAKADESASIVVKRITAIYTGACGRGQPGPGMTGKKSSRIKKNESPQRAKYVILRSQITRSFVRQSNLKTTGSFPF
jgi:hypothetical protein